MSAANKPKLLPKTDDRFLTEKHKTFGWLIFWLFAWQVTVSILVGMIFLDFAREYKNPTAVFLGLAPFTLMLCFYLAWKRIKFD